MKSARIILAVPASFIALILTLPMIFLLSLFRLFSFLVRTVASVIEPASVPWQDVIEFDPDLGWKPKPRLDVHCLAHFDDLFKLHTDQEGWPGSRTLDESDVVVIGDSFAFGYGMDTGSCFFEVEPSLRVKPLGAPGYSMVQPLLLLSQLQHQLRNKLVVWFIFLENDLYDNLMPSFLHYRAPFVRQPNGTDRWEVVTEHINDTKWNYTTQPRPYFEVMAKLCCPGAFSERVYNGCEFILRSGREICEKAGARLFVVTIPGFRQLSKAGPAFLASKASEGQRIDLDLPDRRISEICSNYDIHFVAGKGFLNVSDYKQGEQIHWNKRGHKKIAGLICDLYRAHNFEVFPRLLDKGT